MQERKWLQKKLCCVAHGLKSVVLTGQQIWLKLLTFFLPRHNSPLVGQGLLFIEDSISYSDTPHSVVLLWTSDQPSAETSTLQHNIHSRLSSMPLLGFEPTIPASQWPQTHTLDCAATRISHLLTYGI
jgi:hypothetical protein